MKKMFTLFFATILLSVGVLAAPGAAVLIEPNAENVLDSLTDDSELMATYGDLTYSVSGGEVTITDCSETATSVTIPSTIDGYPVTSIGEGSFFDCTSLLSIDIPVSITSIGYAAFQNCTSLTSIEIPDSVKSIGSYAFSDCMDLVSVEIPSGVTSIGGFVFEDCTSLISVKIPSGIMTIGSGAFSSCTSLVSVEIPGGVTNIGSYAFYNCTSLEKVTVLSKDVIFDLYVFYGCSNLTICGYSGSTSETYAKKNGIPFTVIDYPVFILGDLNSDGVVDMNDAILLLQHSMFPELYPIS